MFRHNLVSIAVTAVLLSGSFNSVANTQKPDEEDSVRSWGKWANPFETAAGDEFNGQALSFGQFSQSESGRNGDNEPDIRLDDTPDPRLREYVSWGKGTYDPQVGGHSEAQIGTERARINYTDGPSAKEFDVAIANEDFESTVLNADSSSSVYGLQYQARYFDNADGNRTYLTLEGGNGDYDRGFWYQDTRSDNAQLFNTNEGFFVKGLASTLDAVNQLSSDVLSGNVSAVYSGDFLRGNGSVFLTVNFNGNPTWQGFFVPESSKFAKFDASGTINGADLVGSVTTTGMTGTVEASFFGSAAKTIAGIAEVNNGTSDFVEVFEARQFSAPSNP